MASGTTLGGGSDQRTQEWIDFLWLTVIGVQSDQDVVLFCEPMCEFRESDYTVYRIFDRQSRSELTCTRRKLNDAVGLFVGEGFPC